MKKVITIVGARPQFIKAAAVSRAIRASYGDCVSEAIVHTGQHYDANMSQIFFDELQIPVPKFNLEISGGSHGVMTGRMMEGIERILQDQKPDWVMIYGDTNSTLAGALAAAKMHIPIAHVEAGLRSFNMRMPEEINRVLSDRVSKLLLCPTGTAVRNLANEGIVQGVHNVGDVMYDVALYYKDRAKKESQALRKLGLSERRYALVTCHRAENTDDPARLKQILEALSEISKKLKIVLPLHPRTRKLIADYGYEHMLSRMMIEEPLPFLDMVALEQAAKIILTDSGGVQKEAFFYKVPCITMRDETEWIETLDSGWNQLVGASREKILSAFESLEIMEPGEEYEPFGNGEAGMTIASMLAKGY
ncbi:MULTISPECIES: non-hydrolyzing UDP-N-acetylglucosamine 2-epimerase [Delftia]|uniref:non-hydrolyzing UDP-N-acetylglucosamine 2-epimerase n=1 Tax=Delftia TaxID=80865 RepID=UPI0006407597|nr:MULTISPECIES: UDP-N-acetylglucosamine 2-epimerase (non-hydrolyzing) [Delftia]MBK0111371.1 UDP-N-acetylglucosamine 2-epimerase (non-hydrolyzing) [Delftia sp. S65]MBK0116810.1 UDP-N-acetylglucosamine 2-epimerase (non-hydrolyzing) [Delftia sp. S67]MBK0128089.1 UDP-N-acetylglucosamine 2-epimerase (non-hydrolyzing) [Delftia sp. S66]